MSLKAVLKSHINGECINRKGFGAANLSSYNKIKYNC
jgi:hypothetical protein